VEHPPLHPIPVDDLADPRLADYAKLRDKQLLQESNPAANNGVFIAEGELVVRLLVESPFAVKSVLLTPTRLQTVATALEKLPTGTPVYLVSQEVMNAVVGFNIHRGILACGLRGQGRPLNDLLPDCRTLVVLEDLANHDNVGGIFRCAAALGGKGVGVVLSPGCCDPLYRKAIRVSMGHVLLVPFARCDQWPGAIGRIREAGFRTVALTPAGSVDISDLKPDPGERIALFLGCEGPGLSQRALEVVQTRARIAMNPGVDSLNVVVAAGIALQRLGRV
jgi:tRNA G18 (ribose-2'-O)-methylase SpoU